MKWGTCLLIGLLGAGAVSAQSPSGRRIVGSGSTGSAGIRITPQKPGEVVTRRVTYMALTQKRQWLSADGRSVLAQLVAFDIGDEATFTPPTIVREEKVRLLKDGKEYIIPIDKLDPEHQDDILEIEDRINSVYAARKAAAERAGAGAGTDAGTDAGTGE